VLGDRAVGFGAPVRFAPSGAMSADAEVEDTAEAVGVAGGAEGGSTGCGGGGIAAGGGGGGASMVWAAAGAATSAVPTTSAARIEECISGQGRSTPLTAAQANARRRAPPPPACAFSVSHRAGVEGTTTAREVRP
jgi:hypothetical protein